MVPPSCVEGAGGEIGHDHRILLCLCACTLMGQSRMLDGPELEASKAVFSGDYGKAEKIYAELAFKPDCSVADPMMLNTLQYVREWIDGRAVPDSAIPGKPAGSWQASLEEHEAVARAEARDALDEIVRRAAETRVVMLNEHHHVPRSRAFAAEMAQRLRPLGYTVLAAETFSNPPDLPNMPRLADSLVEDGYIKHGGGYYSEDPVYAAFVHEALALGYKTAVYESNRLDNNGTREEQIALREQDQAENIAKIIRDNPGAKFLIYVGHAHLAEVPLQGIPWMAARLKTMTGIDPLTIEQARYVGASLATPQDAFIGALESKAKGHSVVLFDKGKPMGFGFPEGAVDLQVIHPVLPDRKGRPGWLFTPERKAVTAPADQAPKDGDILLQAYGAQDGPQAVPIDQVVWRKGAPPPTLVLGDVPVRYVSLPMPASICRQQSLTAKP